MSHDCCKKCGVMEPKPYKQISKMCDLPGCPQRLQYERMQKLFSNIPRQDNCFIKHEINEPAQDK